mmetsp:Transcript_28887/g.21509  ORF Transcript_28887/g.21509 Transcript_28887/m.21509 type:complete len:167 (-) Transcript_28887:820-1320(-)
MLFYSLGMFAISYRGDFFNPKVLLDSSLLSVGMVIILTSVLAYFYAVPITVYVALFLVNGFLQSAGWPMVIAIFSNWFGRRGRGFYLGLMNTSANLGNVLGAFFSSWTLQTLNFNWYGTYAAIGFMCVGICLFNTVLLATYPREYGIVVEELDERQKAFEAILSST